MNVLVCGGREYGQLIEEEEHLFAVLDAQQTVAPISLIIQGGARGADAMARLWAQSRAIDCLTVPARWDEHGRAAGPIRNARMLDYNPILVIAFPGGRGTENMCAQARRAGVKVVRITPE